MDADKRAELEARRAALREGGSRTTSTVRGAQRTAYAAALDPLEATGVDFTFGDINSLGHWIPAWVPQGWGEIPWHLSSSPHIVETGTDPAARAAAVCAMLSELASRTAPVAVLYERDWVGFRLRYDDAVRHMEALIAAAPCRSDIWIVELPAPWLIRIDGDWVLSCVAGEDSARRFAEMRETNRQMRRDLADVRRMLVERGVRARLCYRYDMKSLMPLRITPAQIARHAGKPDLSVPFPADRDERDRIVRDFVAARAPADGRVRFQPWLDAIPVELSRTDFDSHLAAILDACTTQAIFFDPGLDWSLEFHRQWIYGAASGLSRHSPPG
ncbi:hypothetical protein [Sphingosinithalassobacter sp. LHW66-3]|uniref:hypothetical protein n=1 Tax=Sphingosinithalassobacter sp. LHW66-3 TaxID=3424718 RepID=UPI003D6B5322